MDWEGVSFCCAHCSTQMGGIGPRLRGGKSQTTKEKGENIYIKKGLTSCDSTGEGDLEQKRGRRSMQQFSFNTWEKQLCRGLVTNCVRKR